MIDLFFQGKIIRQSTDRKKVIFLMIRTLANICLGGGSF